LYKETGIPLGEKMWELFRLVDGAYSVRWDGKEVFVLGTTLPTSLKRHIPRQLAEDLANKLNSVGAVPLDEIMEAE
jgi:hypothetical protein